MNTCEELPPNLLPNEGEVYYYGLIMPQEAAHRYFERLLHTIEWRNDEAVMFGKHIVTKRKVAWYGDANYTYTYSKITKEALPWTVELLELKRLSEEITGSRYNSCLLNLYHDGQEGMAWHSDDEKTLERNGAIASLSFGAERRFGFRHKRTREIIGLTLEHGSLLVMKGETQTHWQHRLPSTKKVLEARINLTFRSILPVLPN